MGGSLSPENMLVVADEAEAEDGKLRAACIALFGHIKNADPLTEWLKVSGMVNQKTWWRCSGQRYTSG